MTARPTAWWDDRLAGGVVIALAAIVASLYLGHTWVHDEWPRIVDDGRVKLWSGLWDGFVQSYWPPPSKSGLYRPLVMTTLTAQWMLGGGKVLLFRVVDLAAYLGAVWATWRLARSLLPLTAAFAAAALFAVHPIHTEVMAVAVNQAESMVTLLSVLAALAWRELAEGRRSAGTVVPWVTGCYLLALGFKENALILPALLVAMELVAAPATPWRARVAARWRPLVIVLAAGAAWWWLRAVVLGDLTGAAPAEGLRDRDLLQRAQLMLGVVPEWGRLLVWPAHLRMDYAPRVIDPDAPFGAAQLLGAMLLLGWGTAFAWALRADRTVALGLAWVAVGLIPMNNVVMPTGTLLAERTLLLPSVGVVLIAGALLARAGVGGGVHRREAVAGLAATAALLALAIARDVERAPDWRDPGTMIAAELRDSPDSFHALTGYGIFAFEAGDRIRGEASLRRAIAVWPYHARPYQSLADYYRADGLCLPAAALYRTGLELEPDRPRQRISAAACALWLGRYSDAAAIARGMPVAFYDRDRLAAIAVTADSAQRANAPAGSVRLPASPDHAAEVGWRRP